MDEIDDNLLDHIYEQYLTDKQFHELTNDEKWKLHQFFYPTLLLDEKYMPGLFMVIHIGMLIQYLDETMNKTFNLEICHLFGGWFVRLESRNAPYIVYGTRAETLIDALWEMTKDILRKKD